MKRSFAALAAALALASCADDGINAPLPLDPTFHVSEARSGGNPELFFGSPLAPNPQPGDPNFDVGGANSQLSPRVRICETDGAPNAAGCVLDVTQQVSAFAIGLPMEFFTSDEMYRIAWNTSQLNTAKDYRIEIWGVALNSPAERSTVDPRWLFGWRDIRHAVNPADCSATTAFCQITYGQTLQVKVRIEQFAFCPQTRNCAVQFVEDGVAANLDVQLPPGAAAPNAQIFIPAQTGTNFTLAFEPCTTAEDVMVSNAVDIPTYGPCLKSTTTFSGMLNIPAIISLCDALDPTPFGLTHQQEHQLALHHFTTDLSRVQALVEAHQCIAPTSSGVAQARRGLFDVLARVRDHVFNFVTPTPLYATTMIDRGGGGESPFIASFYKLALPAKFEYVGPNEAQRNGIVGSTIQLRTKVIDLFGAPVKNARVHWRAVNPPTDGATVVGSVAAGATLTNDDGVAQKAVTLAGTSGMNVFHAFGRGIADERPSGCTIAPNTPSSCNGPRAKYDPFLPLHVPEFDPVGTETLVELPNGTRLPFKVRGARPD